MTDKVIVVQELGRFHEYVRPVGHPILTEFCTQLTGITQQMVSWYYSK